MMQGLKGPDKMALIGKAATQGNLRKRTISR